MDRRAAAALRCNLIVTRPAEPGFAQGAPPRPRWREVSLGSAGTTLPLEQLQQFFDGQTGCGALRIKARVQTSAGLRETPVVELRRFEGTGFRAALTEQFALPYLFGSGALRHGSNIGSETGWGADCANFLVYALRRQGRRVPWSNPKQLREHLELLRKDVQLTDEVPCSAVSWFISARTLPQ